MEEFPYLRWFLLLTPKFSILPVHLKPLPHSPNLPWRSRSLMEKLDIPLANWCHTRGSRVLSIIHNRLSSAFKLLFYRFRWLPYEFEHALNVVNWFDYTTLHDLWVLTKHLYCFDRYLVPLNLLSQLISDSSILN